MAAFAVVRGICMVPTMLFTFGAAACDCLRLTGAHGQIFEITTEECTRQQPHSRGAICMQSGSWDQKRKPVDFLNQNTGNKNNFVFSSC